MHTKTFFVYILASYKNGSIYTGMTSDLLGRIFEHKNRTYPQSYTARYNIKRLVYYEQCETAEAAIDREKFIKKQTRAYRINLIEKDNPDWSELYDTLNRTQF